MKQLQLPQIIWNHFYPGIILTLYFVLATPFYYQIGVPPQMILLIGVPIIIIPTIYVHLKNARISENLDKISDLLIYDAELPKLKLYLYVAGLVVFSFFVYGVTLPVNAYFSDNLLIWLPEWYKVQDFSGYSREIIILTLVLNFVFNGFLAPIAEEVYFRGYLLPRMERLSFWAPVINAVLFSMYHFWQPQIYLTLIVSLLPMTYLTWKTKCLRLAIYTHCALNLIGAILAFGILVR